LLLLLFFIVLSSFKRDTTGKNIDLYFISISAPRDSLVVVRELGYKALNKDNTTFLISWENPQFLHSEVKHYVILYKISKYAGGSRKRRAVEGNQDTVRTVST
jgi:hypothetical protein